MWIGMIDCQAIRKRWEAAGSKLDERGRRVFAAEEVRAAGWGGLEAVSEITGLARSTIGPRPEGSRRWATAERPGVALHLNGSVSLCVLSKTALKP